MESPFDISAIHRVGRGRECGLADTCRGRKDRACSSTSAMTLVGSVLAFRTLRARQREVEQRRRQATQRGAGAREAGLFRGRNQASIQVQRVQTTRLSRAKPFRPLKHID